jgi:sterol desaturase/sphingolipid hydroxylase (fatty acid hydroxylase superfamily)
MTSDLIATVTGWYHEPMFWLYPMATLAISFSTFLLFALPYTVLAWIDPPSLAKYKVQDKPFDVPKWLGPTVGRLLFNNAAMALILVLSWPWMRLTPIHLGELPAWYIIIAQLLFFIFLDDFLYYGVHRAMHKGWLLKQVHSVHHRIRQTSAINGNYFHLLEFIIISTLALVGPWLVGAHLYVLWIWIVIRQFEAADGHCGYVFPWNPGHIFPLYQGAGYHDFHHSQYQGNYAGFLPYLDRFWGTYARGYEAWRDARKPGKAQAPAAPADRP